MIDGRQRRPCLAFDCGDFKRIDRVQTEWVTSLVFHFLLPVSRNPGALLLILAIRSKQPWMR